MAKTDWGMNDVVMPEDMNQIGQEINKNAADIGDMSTVPTTAKTAAGAITELHSTIAEMGSSEATSNTVVKRDASGRFKAADPVESNDVDTKGARDAALATKLNSSAYTAADVLAKIKTVDGAGSGLDADTLDGFGTSSLYQPNLSWIPVLIHDQPFEIGPYLDFHKVGSTKDYDLRLFIDNNEDVFFMKSNGSMLGLRNNAGNFEFYDGVGWKQVGKGVSVASNNVRESDVTERTAGSGQHVLVYKFIPKTTGEIKFTGQVKMATSTSSGQVIIYARFANREINNSTYAYVNSISGGPQNFNWMTPIGTSISGSIEGRLEGVVTVYFGNPTSFTNFSKIFTVMEGIPVYFTLFGDSNAGGAVIKNIAISYDIIY